MNLKTIVVNLNHEARVPELIAAAAAIARPTEAHVVGLFVMPPLFMPSDVIMPMGADFYEDQVVEHRAQVERIKTIFDRLTHGVVQQEIRKHESSGRMPVRWNPV